MEMRVRFPELLKASGLTPYEVAKRSADRITLTKVYRLKKNGGKLPTYDARMLDALCDVFGVPPTALLDRDDAPPARPSGKPAVRPRSSPPR